MLQILKDPYRDKNYSNPNCMVEVTVLKRMKLVFRAFDLREAYKLS